MDPKTLSVFHTYSEADLYITSHDPFSLLVYLQVILHQDLDISKNDFLSQYLLPTS